MDNLPVILLFMIIFVFIVVYVLYSRRKSDLSTKHVIDNVNPKSYKSEAYEVEIVKENGLSIPIELLPTTIEIDERNLFEITDHAVISRISETIPAAAEIIARTVSNEVLKNVELYKVIIPSGANLAKSRGIEGAERAFYHGAKGISGHADLLKVDPTKISKLSTVTNVAANVINIGSLVVGQYYMSEINSKLESISKIVSKVIDFQETEFKSRIISLITLVQEISNFSTEIMDNDEQRKTKLITLDNLKGNATALLTQVNLTITNISKKNPNPNFQEYQKLVNDLKVLFEYQNALVTVLNEISKLIYLFGKGNTSSDMSYSLFNMFFEQSVKTRNILEQWHNKQVKLLNIDFNKMRISKTGIDKFFSSIPGFVDDKWKYKELKKELAQKISTQTNVKLKIPDNSKDIYDEDAQIIIKNGKYYFLH